MVGIGSRCCISGMFRVVSSAVDGPPGIEGLAGFAGWAVVVAVQFHELGLEAVAGGAEEVDVVGGDERFGDVGVVSHRVSLLVELRAQSLDFGDGLVDKSTVGAAREWLGMTEPLEDVGPVGVERFGEGVKNFSHYSHPNFREHPGQARQPDDAKTFSAIAICCSLDASQGCGA